MVILEHRISEVNSWKLTYVFPETRSYRASTALSRLRSKGHEVIAFSETRFYREYTALSRLNFSLGAKSISIDFESLHTINGNQQRESKAINHLHQYREIQTKSQKSKIINSSSVIFSITVDCSFEANHLD